MTSEELELHQLMMDNDGLEITLEGVERLGSAEVIGYCVHDRPGLTLRHYVIRGRAPNGSPILINMKLKDGRLGVFDAEDLEECQ